MLESDDPAAIYTWAAEWHDVCEFNITPVVDDEQAAVVLQNSRQG